MLTKLLIKTNADYDTVKMRTQSKDIKYTDRPAKKKILVTIERIIIVALAHSSKANI